MYGRYDSLLARRPPIGQRGARVEDEDKAFIAAVLERAFGVPDPRVLLVVSTGPNSGAINQARRELMQAVFVGAAFVVAVWTTLPDLCIENVEDLFVYYSENGFGNKELIRLYEVAQRIGGRNPFFNDELIKELDVSTWEMYMSLREQASAQDLAAAGGERQQNE